MYDTLEKTYITNNLQYSFYTFTNKNMYFTDNVLKFIATTAEPKVLKLPFTAGKELNSQIMQSLNTHDIIVIGTAEAPKYVPTYPIITKNSIILTPILFIQLNGLSASADKPNLIINNLLIKIKIILGGFMSTEPFTPLKI